MLSKTRRDDLNKELSPLNLVSDTRKPDITYLNGEAFAKRTQSLDIG